MSKAIIDSKISISEKVNDLPLGAQLLYTWMLPHVDDIGLIQASAKTIKAKVVPMHNFSTKEVENWLDEMVRSGLLRHVTYTLRDYLYLEGHLKNQKKRRDIQPQTILEINVEKSPRDSWKKLENIINGLSLEDVTDPLRDVTSPDRSATKVKLREVKLINNQQADEIKNKREEIKKRSIDNSKKQYPVFHEWQQLATEHARILGIKQSMAWFKVYKENPKKALFEAFYKTQEMEPVKPEMYFYKLISKAKK